MAVASGGARHVIEATLRHQPFSDHFDTLVTRDDVDRGKPAPDIFLRAAELLGAHPSRCTVYENSDLNGRHHMRSFGAMVPRWTYRFNLSPVSLAEEYDGLACVAVSTGPQPLPTS
jgi:hypothetical protein